MDKEYIYCPSCSKASESGRPIYHTPPACPDSEPHLDPDTDYTKHFDGNGPVSHYIGD